MSVIVSPQSSASLVVSGQGNSVRVTVPARPSIVISAQGPQGPAGITDTTAILQLSTVVNEDVTVGAGKNGLSVGPVTIASGWSVTVSSGGGWMVL